jgi:hypothetical protein
MKTQFLFRFAPSPVDMATYVERRRLAQMFRAYRADRRKYRVSRIADGYSVTCGFAKAIISRI